MSKIEEESVIENLKGSCLKRFNDQDTDTPLKKRLLEESKRKKNDITVDELNFLEK